MIYRSPAYRWYIEILHMNMNGVYEYKCHVDGNGNNAEINYNSFLKPGSK